MNEEEKKLIEKFVEKCNKFDESVEIKGVSVGEEYRILGTVCKALDLVEKLQKENKELRNNYINIQDNTNTTFWKVTSPPEPQLPTKTLCESFSKKKSK